MDLNAEDVYREMPPEEVRCRQGRHLFARDTVLPGQPWPDSVRAWPDTAGRVRLQEPCVLCELVWRVTKTHPGGGLDAFSPPHLVYDPGWVRVPQGMDRRPRMIRQHGYDRGRKKDAASLGAALDRTARQGAEPVAAHPCFQPAGA